MKMSKFLVRIAIIMKPNWGSGIPVILTVNPSFINRTSSSANRSDSEVTSTGNTTTTNHLHIQLLLGESFNFIAMD